MNTIDVLKGTRKLLSDPSAWRQGSYSDADGLPDGAASSEATCWCLAGALERTAGGRRSRAYHDAYEVLFDLTPRGPINFNDDPATTHADVLAVLDCAIESESR